MDEEMKKGGVGTGTIVLVIILVAIVVGGGGYWLAMKKYGPPPALPVEDQPALPSDNQPVPPLPLPETTDTTGWLVYKDKTHGFSISYPKDWTFDQSSLTFIPKGKEEKINPPEPHQVDAEVRIDITDLTKENKTYDQYLNEAVAAGRLKNLQDVTLNGFDAKTGISTPVTLKSVIVLNKGNYVYELLQRIQEESILDQSEQEVGYHILSTFQFTQ